jgi:hypothetical protein
VIASYLIGLVRGRRTSYIYPHMLTAVALQGVSKYEKP